MKLSRSITILALLLPTVPAAAQISLAPPPATTPPNTSAEKPKETPKTKPHTVAKKPAQPAPKPSASPSPPPAATVIPAPQTDNSGADLVFGAYQRGQYKTAFDLAMTRAQAGDPKA